MATTAMKTIIQFRRDTLTNWSSANPVLLPGEVALVDKNNGVGTPLWVIRIGDGTTTFNNLPEMAYSLGTDLDALVLSANAISAAVNSEVELREDQVETLSAEISAKVKIEDTPADYVNISRVDAETYHQLVIGG